MKCEIFKYSRTSVQFNAVVYIYFEIKIFLIYQFIQNWSMSSIFMTVSSLWDFLVIKKRPSIVYNLQSARVVYFCCFKILFGIITKSVIRFTCVRQMMGQLRIISCTSQSVFYLTAVAATHATCFRFVNMFLIFIVSRNQQESPFLLWERFSSFLII